MTMAMTIANTGRSMKNRAIADQLLPFVLSP
jgi:hypothetical protein